MNDKDRLRRRRQFFKFPTLFRSRKPIIGPSFAITKKIKETESPEGDLGEQKDQLFIRKARSIDRAFVSSLGKQLFDVYGPYERAISRWFDHETTATFIAELDRVRVGFIMLGSLNQRFDTPPSFELLAIGLCGSARRKGIGNRLMETVENYAVQRGLDRIFLHTAVMNYPAQQLFSKRGYKPWGVKPQFYPAGQDAFVMAKKI
jgi:ribosomal protein S18 acetylase RimI-like enzyme